MKINQIYDFGIKYSPEKEIGIEIEMEGDYLPFRRQHIRGWSVVGDGSLRGNGAEYILAEPQTPDNAVKAVKELYNIFANGSDEGQRFSINPSDRCGVHFHVNVQNDDVEQVWNFITMYLLFEPIIMKWCGEDREGNLFCLRGDDAEYLLYALQEEKERGYWKLTCNMDSFKYGAMNVASIRKLGSLEFRGLRTHKLAGKICRGIRLYSRLHEYSKQIEDISEEIMSVSHKGMVGYAREILGSSNAKVLLKEDAEELMARGVRNAQILAFTPLGDNVRALRR